MNGVSEFFEFENDVWCRPDPRYDGIQMSGLNDRDL
jgi:hypothetical protein